ALRDHAPFLLGKGCVNVQREWVDVTNAVTMNGTRRTIRLAMNATSRDNRSSFATATWHFAFFAAFSAARSCGLRSSASLPLPVSTSVNSAKISKLSALAKATTARRCASRPKPLWPCFAVERPPKRNRRSEKNAADHAHLPHRTVSLIGGCCRPGAGGL